MFVFILVSIGIIIGAVVTKRSFKKSSTASSSTVNVKFIGRSRAVVPVNTEPDTKIAIPVFTGKRNETSRVFFSTMGGGENQEWTSAKRPVTMPHPSYDGEDVLFPPFSLPPQTQQVSIEIYNDSGEFTNRHVVIANKCNFSLDWWSNAVTEALAFAVTDKVKGV